MTHRGPFQPLLFCDSVTPSPRHGERGAGGSWALRPCSGSQQAEGARTLLLQKQFARFPLKVKATGGLGGRRPAEPPCPRVPAPIITPAEAGGRGGPQPEPHSWKGKISTQARPFRECLCRSHPAGTGLQIQFHFSENHTGHERNVSGHFQLQAGTLAFCKSSPRREKKKKPKPIGKGMSVLPAAPRRGAQRGDGAPGPTIRHRASSAGRSRGRQLSPRRRPDAEPRTAPQTLLNGCLSSQNKAASSFQPSPSSPGAGAPRGRAWDGHCPGRLWSLLLWRYSSPPWTWCCAACSG